MGEMQTVLIVITLPHFLSLMSLFSTILILSHLLSPSVTTWIIQVDSLGQSLTAGETLRNLEEVLEELAKSDILAGAQVGEISAPTPSKCVTK